MKVTDCEAIHDLAVDFVLGHLSGRERANVVSHLEQCYRCRQDANELAAAVDAAVLVVSGVDPPVGFEARTLAAIGRATSLQPPSPQPPSLPPMGDWLRRRSTLRHVLTAAVIAAVVLLTANAGGGRVIDPSVAHPIVLATSGGTPVGLAAITTDRGGYLFMTIDPRQVGSAYECQLRLADGSMVALGEFNANENRADWSGPLPVDRRAIIEVRVLDEDDHVLASGVVS